MNLCIETTPETAAALLAVLRIGLPHPALRDQTMQVLELARELLPGSVEIAACDVQLALQVHDHAEAARVLAAALQAGAGDRTQLFRSLLAACLFAQGDASGVQPAQAVLEDGSNEAAVAFTQLLLTARNEAMVSAS